MRFIEDLRNEHKGKEIWVIGCGSSLDDFPDDFFDDKISITVNWSFMRFPKATYFLCNHSWMPNVISRMRPDLLKKCILSLTSEPYDGITWYKNYNQDPIWAGWDSWCKVETKEAFKEMADKIMKGEACPLVTLKTTVHNAISATVILGAKKVTLAGCETRAGKYKWHAQRGGMWFFYEEPMAPAYMKGFKMKPGEEYPLEWQEKGMPGPWGDGRMREGTRYLAEVFKPYGIEIMRFYYKDFGSSKKGYEKIIS